MFFKHFYFKHKPFSDLLTLNKPFSDHYILSVSLSVTLILKNKPIVDQVSNKLNIKISFHIIHIIRNP